MKIFKEDPSGIEKELYALTKEIYHAHNHTERRSILSYLETLSYFYTIMGYDSTKYLKELFSNKSFIRPLAEKNKTIKNKINNDFINNKDCYLDLFDNIFDDNTEIVFLNNTISNIPNIEENEMYEILNYYFKNTNQKEMLNKFESLINNKRVSSIYLPNDLYRGFTLFDLSSNDSRIFINEAVDYDSIKTMITLAHEMGHVVDYNEIKDFKKRAYYNLKSPFIEVLSSLSEKKFIDFLIDNNIYKNYASYCLQDFYDEMFLEVTKSSIYHTIPNKLLKYNRYQKLTKEELIKAISKDYDILVDNNDFPDPNELDVFEFLAYGYGKILGTYFSRLEKEDEGKYQDEMSKFLSLRTDYFDKNYLEKIGTHTEKVIELVDRDINLSSAKVKVKVKVKRI